MKQTIISIVKVLVATIAGIVVASVLVAYDASDGAIVFTCLGVVITLNMIMGTFDDPAKREDMKHDSIRHYNGRRNYGQAAVFIGTACIFMGTPKECDDMCDDLWHHGQQTKVKMLSGEETNFEIL